MSQDEGAATGPNGPLRVVLDCDTANEIDDQFAIAYALGLPELEVLGVVSVHNTLVHGPSSVDRYREEAQTVTRLCARADLPCPRGAASPMEDAHTPVRSEGLELLVEAAREGPVTLLATGPATDAASLLLVAPELANQVEIVWAGSFPDEQTWQRNKFGELNARADIQAWRALFAAESVLRVLPGWPGVEKVAVDVSATIERLQAIGGPACAYLADLLQEYAAARDGGLDMDDRDGQRAGRKVLWDVVNVAAVSVPEAIVWDSRPLPRVDPAGAPDWNKPGRSVPWGLDVDADAVLDDLWGALERLGALRS